MAQNTSPPLDSAAVDHTVPAEIAHLTAWLTKKAGRYETRRLAGRSERVLTTTNGCTADITPSTLIATVSQ